MKNETQLTSDLNSLIMITYNQGLPISRLHTLLTRAITTGVNTQDKSQILHEINKVESMANQLKETIASIREQLNHY